MLVGPPADDDWVVIADLPTDPSLLRAYDQLGDDGHPPDVAGSFLAGWIADVLLHGVAT